MGWIKIFEGESLKGKIQMVIQGCKIHTISLGAALALEMWILYVGSHDITITNVTHFCIV